MCKQYQNIKFFKQNETPTEVEVSGCRDIFSYRRIFVNYQRFPVDYQRFNNNGDIRLLWMSLSNQVLVLAIFILTVMCYQRFSVDYQRKRRGYRRIFVVYQRICVDYQRLNKNGTSSF